RRGAGDRFRRRRGPLDTRLQPVPRLPHGLAGPRRRAGAGRPAGGLAPHRVNGPQRFSAPLGRGAAVAGWGLAVPEGRLTNQDWVERGDTSDKSILERTVIRERRAAGPG